MAKKDKLLASAQKYLQKGQVAKAIKDYQKIVQMDPKDVRNRQKLAELLGRDKKVAEALEQYEEVAKHYADSGFYLKAIAVYKQMQKLDPNHVELYYRLAELNEKQGLIGNALAEYRNLVAYFEKQERISDAADVLQKMRELEPDNLNILVKIAETYARAGEEGKAREEFDEALALLRGKKDHARIARLYEIFLPIYPDDPEIKHGLARALIEGGDAERGVQMLQNLLQEQPEDPDILHALAKGYRLAGRHDDERLTLQHLLRKEPDDLDLRQNYVRACLDGGESERALEELEERKDAFLDADRVAVLAEFYERLRSEISGDERVATTLKALYEISGEEGKAGQVAEQGGEAPAGTDDFSLEVHVEVPPAAEDEPVVEEAPVPDAEEEAVSAPETVEPAAEAEVEGAEEIPLEFLEDVAPEEALVEEESPAPAAEEAAADEAGEEPAPTEEVPQDEELDLDDEVELELDIDIDVDDEGCLTLEVEEESDEEDAVEAEESPGEEAGGEETVELELIEPLPGEVEAEEEVLDLEEVVPLEEEVATVDVRAEIEEAEFYLKQGLLDDAERICGALLEVDPESAAVRQTLDEIETRRQREAGEKPAAAGLFDLAAEVGEDGFPALEQEDIDFADSQKGIETEIDSEDTESHYNLGIAYKEMGLLDDAVAEFDKAMRSPRRAVDCLTLKGLCLAESGALEEAEGAFQAALAHEQISDEERISVTYELGLLLERAERFADALDCFQSVAEADLFHRDVGEKVEALRKRLGLESGNGDDDAGGQGSKDRVSYV